MIALKSELARRLVEREPERAAAELDDIQAVTRDALTGVREAVKGYRRRSLAQSSRARRRRSIAAGIDCELRRSEVALPEDVDAVLAWAVREGATNVIRHSRAQHCAIRVDADGAAPRSRSRMTGAARTPASGSGLSGLRERAQRLRGELEAGARPEGGFRLTADSAARVRHDPRAHRGGPGDDPRRAASLLALEDDIEVVVEVERGDRGRRGGEAGSAGRRTARHRDAGPRRDHRRRSAHARAALDEVVDPDDVRPAGFPPAGTRRRRERLPAQGRPGDRVGGRDPTVASGGTAVDARLAASAITEGDSPLTPREHEVLAARRAMTPRPTSRRRSSSRRERCGTT